MDWMVKFAMTLFAFVLPVALTRDVCGMTVSLIIGGVMAVAMFIAMHFIMRPSNDYDGYDRY